MEKLINDLMSNKITLTEFIYDCKKINKLCEESVIKTLDSYRDEDHSAIVYLILYYIYKHKFTSSNPFISFLDSIEDEIDIDYSKEVKYHYIDGNQVVFQIDHLYFIINNSSKALYITLPNELQSDYLFCVNCNHELYFEEKLLLESYEFYILSNEK